MSPRRAPRDAIEPLEPGRTYTVRVEIDDIAHAFPAGHRIAVSVSSTYWPMVWPSPGVVTLPLHAGRCHLELPVRPVDPADADIRPFDPPIHGRDAEVTNLRAAPNNNRIITRDAEKEETTVRILRDRGYDRFDEIGTEMGENGDAFYSIVEGEPLSARAWTGFETLYRKGDIDIRILTRQRMWSTLTDLHLEAEIEAFENGRNIFARTWNERFPREGL